MSETFRDDRQFVLHVAPCHLDPPRDGNAVTTIFHEEPFGPPGPGVRELWCVVTYRNTRRYPIARVDHFSNRTLATAYLRQVEPQTPLVSRGGLPMDPPIPYEEWQDLKIEHGWEDYDFNQVFEPGGSHAHEVVTQPASSVRIYTDRLSKPTRSERSERGR